MSNIKDNVQGIDANLQARDLRQVSTDTSNVYKAVAVMAKRAKQLSYQLKEELHTKLEEFAITSDTIEEVHENKEQIEISKFYERLPHPTVIAFHEFMNDELEYGSKTALREEAESDEDESED